MTHPRRSHRPMRHFLKEHAPSILVASLGGAFGTLLIQATADLSTLFGIGSEGVSALMSAVALTFTGISVYVGAIVIANTFATIVAARTRSLALLRLLGADATGLRRSVTGEGLVVGLLGSVIGAVVGIGLSAALLAVGRAMSIMPPADYPWVSVGVVIPLLAVTATTWAASRVGSRQVLAISPAQAIGSAGVDVAEPRQAHAIRSVAALILGIGGLGLILLGILAGMVSPLGMVIAMAGGFSSFAGVIVGANRVMPALLSAVGGRFGRGVPARLAAANAVRYPARSTRTTVGIVIGVTLITTFAVAGSTFRTTAVAAATTLQQRNELDQVLAVVIGVLSVLVGFSVVIAAVGMVNNLSLSVLQRTKEIGLLRALGLSVRQVRRMILIEAVQMSVTATVLGLLLGVGYGWAGAQSLLGSVSKTVLVIPEVPWQLLVAMIVGAAALAAVASIVPSLKATRIAPVQALAMP